MHLRIIAVLVIAGLFLVSCGGGGEQKNTMQETANPAAEAPEGAIKWVHNLADGLNQAQSEGKPLMVDFTAGWCGWCKKLDKDVFTNAKLAEISNKFVNVKVDTDRYPEDANKYGVRGLPTIMFMNAQGKVLNQIVGYSESDEFIRIMTEVLNG